MNLIKLICKKSKFTGKLCDFRKGNVYEGIFINETLMVDGNHGDIHFFENKGVDYFEITSLPKQEVAFVDKK
ncbi:MULTISPECIES: hypothetical protein [Bacillota]|uniref:hypothetical protein n=1 Tax=Bacillota TaxID=1239 RepID=UPI0039EF83CF